MTLLSLLRRGTRSGGSRPVATATLNGGRQADFRKSRVELIGKDDNENNGKTTRGRSSRNRATVLIRLAVVSRPDSTYIPLLRPPRLCIFCRKERKDRKDEYL